MPISGPFEPQGHKVTTSQGQQKLAALLQCIPLLE